MRIYQKHKKTLITSIVSLCCVFALALGLILGLCDFSPKASSVEPANTDTQSATQPTNTSYYWDEAHVAGLVTLNFDWSGPDGLGDGSEEHPWIISSAADLAGLSYVIYKNNVSKYTNFLTDSNGTVSSTASNNKYYFLGKYFKQTTDIDLKAYWWQPIGIAYDRSGTSTPRYFSGNYDGTSHTVSGVFTQDDYGATYYYKGLFGYINGKSETELSVICNLGIKNSIVKGNKYVGGIVGYANLASISKCYNYSQISITSNGGEDFGGIVGYASFSTLSDCYNNGVISSTGSYTSKKGGIVGYIDNATITRCYNLANLTQDSIGVTGGIAGYCAATTITECYNLGDIIGGSDTGGIVGILYMAANRGTNIFNCYNAGAIKGSEYTGGILGEINSRSSGYYCYIYNVFNIGSVSADKDYVGGISGYWEGYIYNVFNVGAVSSASATYIGGIAGAIDSINEGQGLYFGGQCTLENGCYGSRSSKIIKITNLNTTAYAKGKDWFVNNSNWYHRTFQGAIMYPYPWDFDTVWEFRDGENDGYPVLQPPKAPTWLDFADTSYETDGMGDGSESRPYIIDTPEKLAGMASRTTKGENQYEGKHFLQTANIDLAGYDWVPIGTSNGGTSMFKGIFDGGNFTIKNMNVTHASGDFLGLFGSIIGSTIKNISLRNSTVISETAGSNVASSVGSVVGLFDTGSLIENCHSNAIVKGFSTVGGIGGFAWRAGVKNCSFSGQVENTGESENYGGIVGKAYGVQSVIENCEFAGNVKGYNGVGGIVGFFESDSNTEQTGRMIKNCNSSGRIEGSYYVGGIVAKATSNRIIDCSSSANIVATGNAAGTSGGSAGGIVCILANGAEATNCFFSGNIKGIAVGGIAFSVPAGATVKNCYVTDASITGTIIAAGLAGAVVGTVENCLVSAVIEFNGVNNNNQVGGIVANCNGTISNVLAKVEIYFNGTTTTSVGAIAGRITATGKITNSSVIGGCNVDINSFYGTCVTGGVLTNSYAIMNLKKEYTGTDFSGFGLVEGMNNGLPMQRELFFMAEFAPEIDVTSYFADWVAV